VAVLPWTTGLDKTGRDVSIFDPLLHLFRDELRAIVALDRGRRSVQFNQLLKNSHDRHRRQVTRALNPKGSTGELINDCQKPKRLSIGRLIRNEVVAPHVIRILGLVGIDRAGPSPTPFRSRLRHPQAFAATK
jgi:hypothetical protein